jgi:3',5'-cyclic AMP phosphodiesterase CpdA
MTESNFEPDRTANATEIGTLLLDPRHGDVEDDSSSPKKRSLLAIAGSLVTEISLPKLALAWTVSILLPAIVLGSAPLIATAVSTKASQLAAELTGLGALLLLAIIAVGLIGWQPLLRTIEVNFWSLNALAVQPGYAFCREALRYLIEHVFDKDSRIISPARLRSVSSAGAAILLCAFGALIAMLAWPASRWAGTMADLLSLHRLLVPILANTIVVMSAYLAIAALIWGFADASMDQPTDLRIFDAASNGPTWRIAHLSDIHLVGEQYGFRIECGRNGPRGNGRFTNILARIEAIHSIDPLDIILISGDMTDAGRATEWAEFLDAVAQRPALAERMIILPGNHDLNIVDRLNPARLDLPFSPGKRLRQMRALSVITAVQGQRVRVVDPRSGKLERTLAEGVAPYRQQITAFADSGSLRLSAGLGQVWDEQFPMILPPDSEDGLGMAILNSNSEAHFSFTNALGMISAGQMHRLTAAIRNFPRARWVIALHHHLMEYPRSMAVLSERVGTALINGSWFVRSLKSFATRTVVMHGHRHIDWIGLCGKLKIVSAPSPVMGAENDAPTYFLIHTLAPGPDGQIHLLSPQRVEVPGVNRSWRGRAAVGGE